MLQIRLKSCLLSLVDQTAVFAVNLTLMVKQIVEQPTHFRMCAVLLLS